jgi:hypothetical protein
LSFFPFWHLFEKLIFKCNLNIYVVEMKHYLDLSYPNEIVLILKEYGPLSTRAIATNLTKVGKVYHENPNRTAYKYWLQWLEKAWIIKRDNELYSLTKLGNWVSEGLSLNKLEEFAKSLYLPEAIEIKSEFSFHAVCKEHNPEKELVIFRPVLKTAHISTKDIFNCQSICPICGKESFYQMHNRNRSKIIMGIS